MPSLWSGSLTFGLVSIPVRLETSLRSKEFSFNFLHKDCLQRINMKYYCGECDKYLDRDDLVRGYEYEKDQYVVMESEDFEKIEGEASRVIDVIGFVEQSEIKPIYLNKTYYLIPEKGAEKGYKLFIEGLRETEKVGIARFVMRGKEYIGAVAPAEDKGLLLHVLYHEGEFKQAEEVFDYPQVEVRPKELSLAKQIIDNLTEEFSGQMLKDEYKERLTEVIQQKIEGREVTIAEKKAPAKVLDLMEALKRSLEVTAEKKPAARIGAAAIPAGAREKKRKRA